MRGGWPIWCGMAWHRPQGSGAGFWFRIDGRGLIVERLKGHRPYFSERYGYTRAYHALGLCWRPLSRGKLR